MSEETKSAEEAKPAEVRTENDLYKQELPEVAKNIYLPCKKCEVDTYHKVLAHKTEVSCKIQCEVCDKKATFRIRKPKSTKTRTRKKTLSPEEIWANLKAKIGDSGAADYNMGTSFAVDTSLNHKKFGLGFIVAVEAQKIEVAFEDGAKFLVHNRQ